MKENQSQLLYELANECQTLLAINWVHKIMIYTLEATHYKTMIYTLEATHSDHFSVRELTKQPH